MKVEIDKKGWVPIALVNTLEPLWVKSNPRKGLVAIRHPHGTKWTMPRQEFLTIIKSTEGPCRNCRGGKLGHLCVEEKKAVFLVCSTCGCYHKLIEGKPYPYTAIDVFYESLFGGNLGRYV